MSALVLLGCQDDFPLGSWAAPEAGGSGGSAGSAATGTAGMPMVVPPQPAPSCGALGTPGDLNVAGPLTPPGSVGTTNLYTDWSWPTPVDSLEWDLVIENDPPNDGYYWAHQFSFVNGLTGFVGLQAHGGYQIKRTDPADFVKMLVFWIGGADLAAELGDIQLPNARVLVVNARGADWMTIHARYEWTACDVYRLRLATDGTDPTGNVWYGAWIEDLTTHTPTFLGRIAVPAEWGQLSRLSTVLTTRIDDKPMPIPITSCDQPEPASAIFGTPTANDGQLLPTHVNRFIDPARCPSSRFTDLPAGVRHEIAVPPSVP